MSTKPTQSPMSDTSSEQPAELTLVDVSRTCAVQTHFIIELVQEGVIAPQAGTAPDSWRFADLQLRHVSVASRLQRDLGVNPAGAALALQLLDEIETLRAQITASASGTDDDSA